MNDNDRSIMMIVMVAHALVHTFELSIPILIPIWMSEFAVTPATIGLITSAGYGLFGLGSLPGGILTDIYDSHRMIVGCLIGMGVSFLLLATASNIVWVTLALLVWGAAASVYHPSGLTLISTGMNEHGTGFAYHGMAGNVGTALGPLGVVLLLIILEWELVVALIAIPTFLAGIITYRMSIDETAAIEQSDEPTADDDGSWSPREFLASSKRLFLGGFLIVFPIVILEGLYYRGVLTFLPDLMNTFALIDPIAVAGGTLEPSRYIYIGLLMIGIIGQYFAGRLTDYIRPERGMVGAFALLIAISLLFIPAASYGLVALLVVSALLGIVLFAEQPFMQATVARFSASDVRGLSYGYTYLGAFGVGALGAAISGTVLTYSTYDVLFVVLALIAATACLLGIYLSTRDESALPA